MSLRIPYYRPGARPRSSSFSASIGGGVVDYSPLSDALWGLADLWADQQQADRESKHKLATAGAAQDVRRLAFGISDPNSPDYVADPAARPDAFLKGKASIRDRYLKALDDQSVGGHDSFDAQFENTSLSEEFDVRRAATIALRDKQEGDLDATLFQSEQLAGEGSPAQTAQWREFGLSAIDTAEAGGVISAVDAQKRRQSYLSGIIETRVRRDILADPHAAEQALLSGDYEGLDPDKRVSFIGTASGAAEREERRREAAESRAIRLQEKAEKEHADVLQKEGDRLVATGKLTPSWIEANRDDLEPDDYRHFYKALEEDSAPLKDNPNVYADLRLEAGKGLLQPGQARQAFLDGQITRDSLDRLLSLQSGSDQADGKSWVQDGESYIGTALKPSDLNPADGGGPARLAEALDGFREWARAHPDASPEEARKIYKGLADQFAVQNFRANLNTILKGSPTAAQVKTPADLDAAEEALVNEFSSKHGGNEEAMIADPEFQRRSQELVTLRAAAPATEEAPNGGR